MFKHRSCSAILCLFIAAVGLFIVVAFTPSLRARVVMAMSSRSQFAASPLKELGVEIDLPAGNGWFPDMLVFHDNTGLKDLKGDPLDLTIFYTFGAFEHGHSKIYTPKSGYYASFYGAYAVHGKRMPEATEDLLENVAAYDYQSLILSALGYPEKSHVFKVSEFEQTKTKYFLGNPGWLQYDLTVSVPGVAHAYQGWKLHYWQFGTPPPLTGPPFEPLMLFGRLYVKTLPERNLVVIVYMFCESKFILEETDQRLEKKGSLWIKNE